MKPRARPRVKTPRTELVLHVPRFLTMPMVPQLIERAGPLLQSDERYGRIVVDASELEHVSPIGLATLASMLLLAARTNRFDQGLVIPPNKKRVKTYLSRMNFNRLLQMRERERPHRSPRHARFRELVEVGTAEECVSVPEQILAVLTEKIELTDVVVSNVMYCLSELLDNVLHHAESPTNGIACAQAYEGTKAVELAIVDCGIGIRRSLLKNPEYAERAASHGDAVRLALQRGVTSTPGRNSGEGLFFVAQFLARTGRMRVHSGDALLSVSRKGIAMRVAPTWPGTIVGLRFELKRGVPIREIFDRYAPLPAEPQEELTLFPLDRVGMVREEAQDK